MDEGAPCRVFIRRNADGETRRTDEITEWLGDYMWADGNFSCDCNRSLFFDRAGSGPEPSLDEVQCGNDAYSVRITDDAGGVVYEDGDWPATPCGTTTPATG